MPPGASAGARGPHADNSSAKSFSRRPRGFSEPVSRATPRAAATAGCSFAVCASCCAACLTRLSVHCGWVGLWKGETSRFPLNVSGLGCRDSPLSLSPSLSEGRGRKGGGWKKKVNRHNVHAVDDARHSNTHIYVHARARAQVEIRPPKRFLGRSASSMRQN